MELRTARRIAGLTQQQLAKKSGVDHSSISRFERDNRQLHRAAFEDVVRLARALNLEPEELAPVEDLPLPTAVNQ